MENNRQIVIIIFGNGNLSIKEGCILRNITLSVEERVVSAINFALLEVLGTFCVKM